MFDPTAPRWPLVRPGSGHYESYYLRAVHPREPRGVWIRYTVLRPAGGEPSGQLWCTLFDRASAPAAVRAVRADAGEPTTGDGAAIRLGASSFGEESIAGSVTTPDITVSWSLRPRGSESTLLHLPRPWMYSARLPRTKLLSLSPSTLFDGELEVDGTPIAVEGWPGMLGHNWGEEHAPQWIWLHGLAFDGAGSDTWLDVALARIRLGPVTTPWIANGAISIDGRRLRLGGLGRRVTVTADGSGATVRIPGAGGTLTAAVSAPAEAVAAWDYPGPDGSVRRVRNCSVADLTVRVIPLHGRPRELTAAGRAVYELGGAAGEGLRPRRLPHLPRSAPNAGSTDF